MAEIIGGQRYTNYTRRVWTNAGAPSDGGSGTLVNQAEIGDLLIDTTNKKLYQNRNTLASPTWTEIAASSVDLGEVGDMAANGTATANACGVSSEVAPIDHVHKIGDHDHSDNTKGNAIALAALGADFFTADATGRGKFQTGILDAATLLDLVAADALSNANCDAFFAASAFAADADSRAIFADGIWTTAKMASGLLSADATGRALFAAGVLDVTTFQSAVAAGVLSADATGRAFMATGFFSAAKVLDAFAADSFDAAACAAVIEDNAIPSGKVNWSYGGVGDIVTIVADASAATGSAAGVARIDHAHAIVCGAPADGSLAAANAEGSSNEFARRDHAHKAILLDDVDLLLGTGSDVAIRLSSANTNVGSGNEDMVIAVSDVDQSLHITDLAAIATDWDLASTTHPTLYIHSNTTPATDYLALSHDATDGVIDSVGGNLVLKATSVELVSIEAAGVIFNEGGIDLDFRVESADVDPMLVIDGLLNVMGIGVAASANSFVGIAHPAKTLVTAAEFASVRVSPAGAITTAGDASTYDYLASLYLAEPNITKGAGDTITLAATLYVASAPDEASANYAIYVASGATGLQALDCAGALTVAGAVTINDAGADVDFRVESDNLQYALAVDAGKDCVVIGDNTDVSDVDVRLRVGNVAKTLAANESASLLWVAPTGATTTSAGAGVHAVIASAYFAEPNLTAATGTITVAATVYIADAPTEGVANAALYVAAGATTLQALDCAALTCTSVTVDGGEAIKSSSATEIGITVDNSALAVGSAGSIKIPYLSSTGAAFSDAIGGDQDGCIGLNYDSDAGPTSTLEVRVEGSWLSVALAGIEIQGKTFGGSKKKGEKWHDNQITGENTVDETICAICGKKMKVEEPVVLYPNYERHAVGGSDSLHCIFAHLACATA